MKSGQGDQHLPAERKRKENPHQILRMLKRLSRILDFVRKYTDGLRRRHRSLPKIWSGKKKSTPKHRLPQKGAFQCGIGSIPGNIFKVDRTENFPYKLCYL